MGEGLKRARAAARATRTTPSGPRDRAVRAEDNQRHVRETLAARDPEFAWTVDRAARAASPRAGRESR